MERRMKIAFVLLRTIGDIVIGNTLVKNIKIKYPNSDITWIINSEYNDLISDNPNITEIKNFESWDDILSEIVKLKYDEVMIPAQTTPIDNMWHHYARYNKRHLLNFYAERCDIEIKDPSLELYVKKQEFEWPEFDKPVVVIHTTSLVDVKNWDRFDELTEKLKTLNYEVVQFATSTDKKIQNAKVYEWPLKKIMQFFDEKRCQAFIGLDSGLSYIASALRVPTVALYGATAIETSGCYADKTSIILADNNRECKRRRSSIRCHGIMNGKCEFGEKCINKITVENVIDRIKLVAITPERTR